MADGIELLSPAGNFRALTAAVQSGADAVYIGGKKFSARGSAENFTVEEIQKCADYCHLYGVKLHAAVNTLIKERELGECAEYVRELNRAGVDALIVQDLGAARMIKEICPDMSLHASTQMTVTSAEGVKYLENMGFSRVVLARELTKNEIEYIIDNTSAEIEVFVHGALCMCYSGQCLMSSVIGGRSANRGRCAQPCRLPYKVGGGRDIYALSPKDLALINELDELKRMGVKSLKIEGRLKRAEYVSAVTGIYRKYLDLGGKITDADMAELKNAFSRSGFTDGYFNDKPGAGMMSRTAPGNVSGNVFTDAAKDRARENANIRKIPVTVYASLKAEDVLRVTVTDGDHNAVTAVGTLKAEPAKTVPLTAKRLGEQLNKLGSTPFTAEDIYAETDEGITVAVREINAVRRAACELMVNERIKRDTKRERAFAMESVNKPYPERTLLTAECETLEQAVECLNAGVDILYVPEELYGAALRYKNGDTKSNGDTKIAVCAPDIFDGADIKAGRVMVPSAAAARYYEKKTLYGGARLNVFNSLTADEFKDMELVTVSPELNIGEARALVRNTAARCELIVYGRLTLMLMKNCPVKADGKCGKSGGSLRDRKNEVFPILCAKACTARLINSKPIFTADKAEDILSVGADALRLVFTVESAKETARILRLYKDAVKGRAAENPFGGGEFTRGHYYRGVE